MPDDENGQATTAGSQSRTLISVVIPVYNEDENVVHAYETICKVIEPIGRYDLEFIFTDNHSEDDTFKILEQLGARDHRVKVLRFTRNYGFQRSLLTGYRYATGDAAIQFDCDLQDPPDLIPQFISYWEKGHDTVVGLRRRRQENMLLTLSRRTFYVLLHHIAEERITSDAGDFRLVDRRILDQLRVLNETHPYVRGIISSLSVNEKGVPYDRAARLRGRSKFPVAKLVSFAMDGIISHSVLPLRIATYTGIALSLLTFLLSLYYVAAAVLYGAKWPPGFATTTVLILLGMSLNAIFLGVIGEYISRIYHQSRHRPLTLIERSINVNQRP